MRTTSLALVFAASLFGQSYTVSTFAGGGLPVNVAAPSASIGPINSVAVDTAGNLYFPSGNAILRMDSATRILTAVAGTGVPGFSGDGGPATAAELNLPNAIAIDSSGNIYIADGNRIREISAGIISTIAGNGTLGTTGDNGPALSAEIAPLALAVDSAGNIYFTDTVNIVVLPGLGPIGSGGAIKSGSVRKITNGLITTIAGNGTFTAIADNVPATSVPIYDPNGIAVDSAGNIYVASSASPNTPALVRKISNGILTTLAGGATPTAASNTPVYSGPPLGVTLGALDGLALDSAGDIFIADVENNVVREISHGVLTTVAGYGPAGYGGDGGPATGARLSAPQGIAVDSAGNLYIADWGSDVIREVSSGIITTAAGNGAISFSGDGGPATSAQLSIPAGLATDSAGNLYIADQDNWRIREVSHGIIATVAGGAQGFSGDGGPATAAGLYNPEAVAVDSAGNIYIADTVNSCVREVSNGVISTIAGRGSGVNGFGDGGPATAAFFASVVAVAVDSAGNVYVTDTVANRVRKISNGIITTFAGNGNPGYSGDGGPATAAQLWRPAGLAIDAAGNLYIDDGQNNRIREVSNGVITTFAGTGVQASNGDGGPATSAAIAPAGLAIDSAGNVYISDFGSIRMVSGGVIHAIAGTGTAGYSGENLPALSSQIFPGALAVDSAGNIYFSEPGANRVRVLRPQSGACAAFIAGTQRLVIGNAGGPLNLNVLAEATCPWTVPGLPSWISYAGTGGTGPATIAVTVAANAGAPRSATFFIANSAFAVTQESQLSIATASPLPITTTGVAYSQTLTAAGGSPPYTWSLISGTLPPGVTLSGAGAIAGTPAAAGIYNFTVQVTDGASALTSATYNLTAIVPGSAPPPGSIVTHALGTPSPMAIDSAGNIYGTIAPNQVTAGAAQTQPGGGTCPLGPVENMGPCPAASVGKFGPAGQQIFGTLLGGQTQDSTTAIAVDAAGNVYFAGLTQGSMPTTSGAAIANSTASGFAAKLSADGSRFLYVTYLPASMVHPTSIAVDSAGNAYIGGWTPAYEACVVKLSPDGSAFLYNVALAGTSSATALTVVPSGDIVVTGEVVTGNTAGKAFVQKLDSSGNVIGSMSLGGSGGELPGAIAADSAGNIYVMGQTGSTDFPTTPDSYQPARNIPLWNDGRGTFGFLAKFAPDLSAAAYSTYLLDDSNWRALAVGAAGDVYLAGVTRSGFPITASAPVPCPTAGPSEYVLHLAPDGSMQDGTYAGATVESPVIGLTSDGAVLLAGEGNDGGLVQQIRFGDAGFAAPACITPTVLNAASQTPSAVPGELVTLVGWGIGPRTGVVYTPGPQGQIPTSTGGVQVFFDGVAAPVLYAQSQQVNAEAPFSITGTTVVTLKYNGTTFGPFSMPVTFADPEILRQQPNIATQALAFNQDNTMNGPANPAAPGSVVYFYGTGFGPTSPGCAAGGPNVQAAANLAGVTVTANGGAAPVQYAGSAPSLPCGIAQINMQIPASAPSGTFGIGLTAQMGANSAAGQTNSTIVVK